MNTILSVKHLTKTFTSFFGSNSFTAVDDISFNLRQGEILGLLGPNGAGKTTTIQMLLSTMTPTAGSIRYFGKDLGAHREEILQRISFASTYIGLQGRLTVYENLNFHAQLYGLNHHTRRERIEQFLKQFDMWRYKDRQAGVLSAGETTRVMLAKAFLTEPDVVLLDEPTASLDPDIALDVRHFVLKQREDRGVSILFTSHNMDEVTEVCDRVLVLKNGKIYADNTPDELARSVSLAHLQLSMVSDMHRLIEVATSLGLMHTLDQRSVRIEIDERSIAGFLAKLAHDHIEYQQISIDKPTLQDYFINVSKSSKAGSR